jgi:hypothetical protein
VKVMRALLRRPCDPGLAVCWLYHGVRREVCGNIPAAAWRSPHITLMITRSMSLSVGSSNIYLHLRCHRGARSHEQLLLHLSD